MKSIGFIGLGNMGSPMTKNLLKNGFSVRVFDLVSEHVDALRECGAYGAASAEDAIKGVDALITMLPAGTHVSGLLIDNEALLSKLSKGTLVIDCSTIDAETSRSVHQHANNLGLPCLDSPVSGGVAAATAGTLSFMCGGSSNAFDAAKPILQAMGANVFLAGSAGSGQVAKMCNNMLLAIHMIGTSEALKLGEKNGLDASVLSTIMKASSGDNWSLERYNPYPGVMENAPASNNYQPGFMVDLMTKDLSLALSNAIANGCATPLGRQAYELYQEKQKQGDGQRDFSSIIELIEQQSE